MNTVMMLLIISCRAMRFMCVTILVVVDPEPLKANACLNELIVDKPAETLATGSQSVLVP